MSVIDDILGNEQIGDDMEISLGDKTLKVGDLRGYRSEFQQTRARADQLAAERDAIRTERDRLSGSVTSLLERAGQMTDDDSRRAAPATDVKETLRDALSTLLERDDPAAALFEDKVFGRALSRVEEKAVERAMAKNAELEATVKELQGLVKGGFEAVTRAQLHERENRWYDINRNDIPKDAEGKRLSLDQIRQYAHQRNMVVPGTQLLDFDAALNSLTEPDRIKSQMTEAEKRGYEKGLAAARANAGKVLPIFGDRSAGGGAAKSISTAGKTQRQIMSEAIGEGLANIASGEE